MESCRRNAVHARISDLGEGKLSILVWRTVGLADHCTAGLEYQSDACQEVRVHKLISTVEYLVVRELSLSAEDFVGGIGMTREDGRQWIRRALPSGRISVPDARWQ